MPYDPLDTLEYLSDPDGSSYSFCPGCIFWIEDISLCNCPGKCPYIDPDYQ